METTKTKAIDFKVVDDRRDYWRTLGHAYVIKRKNRHYVIITNEEDEDDKEIYAVAPEYYHFINTATKFKNTIEINYEAFLSLILPAKEHTRWKKKLTDHLAQKLEIAEII